MRIPADVDREDTLLAGLTARQLAILATAAVILWSLYQASHRVLPLPVLAAAGTPIVCAALVLALGRRDGMTADRLGVAAIRHLRSPRVCVPATDASALHVPEWVGLRPPMYPSPLHLPAHRISDDGVFDLGDRGAALICRASAITFGLRTEAEQEALVAGYARFLNSLSASVQVVVRSEVIDLTDEAAALEEGAATLAHPGVEQAARAHARFLRDLSERRDALRRVVLLVLHDAAGGSDAGIRLRRMAEDAQAGLSAAGIAVTVLDGPSAANAIRSASVRGRDGAAADPGAVIGRANATRSE